MVVTNSVRKAAVLLALRKDKVLGDVILLTLRAAHLSSHGGEVAFPGGMWEPGDPSLKYTALRESQEEVGLSASAVHVESQLPVGYTRAGVQVTPFVGRIIDACHLSPNPDELEALFWMPLSELKEDRRVRTDIFTLRGSESWAPVYEYEGYTIWGFTARLLVEFINRHCRLSLSREHSMAPEVIFNRQ